MAGADSGVLELPYKASGNLTKLRAVTLSGDQTVAQASAGTDQVLGICKASVAQSTTEPNKAVAIQVLGVAWVEAGAAVTRANKVMSDGSGRAITATSTNRPFGIALKAAANAGDWIPVLLTPGMPVL